MTKIRRLFRSPAMTVVLFVLAAAMLLGGTIGGARAALTVESEFYSAGVEMYDIGVTLMESNQADGGNARAVSKRDYVSNSNYQWDETAGALPNPLRRGYTYDRTIAPLLSRMVPENESLQLHRAYPEVLSVYNSGAIDEFVRVSVYKYWVELDENNEPKKDSSGNIIKRTDLDPALIDLAFVTGNGWVYDTVPGTDERTVLYYTSAVPVGAATAPFTSTLTIDGELNYIVEQTGDKTIVTTYVYDSVGFQVEVEVDAVQTHNAEAAILSAWGRSVTVSGNALRLN